MENETPFQQVTTDFFSSIDLGVPLRLPGDLEAKAETMRILPSCLSVVRRIHNVLSNPNASAGDIEEAIELDPHVSLKLLTLAAEQGGNIRSAIHAIGTAEVRRVVEESLVEPTFELDDWVAMALWKHAAATATLARLIAFHESECDPQAAFSAGLFHDLGAFVLHEMYPIQYQDLFSQAVTKGWQFEPLERVMFGVDHAEVGAHLAMRWGLSRAIVASIRLHHDLGRVGTSAGAKQFVATIALADDLVHANLDADGLLKKTPIPVTTAASEIINLSALELRDVWQQFIEMQTELMVMLGH